MSDLVRYEDVKDKILDIQGQQVLLDSSVAELYGVETKRVNEAVSNNPDKFPDGYIISLDLEEWNNMKSKISTSSWGGKNKPPKAFTEKGLYMLATILKSPKATQTTIAIVETFAKFKELSRTIDILPDTDDENQQKALVQRTGEILSDILYGSDLGVSETETSLEVNLALVKVKHTVKRAKREN